ncbi:hypothetical protein U1Q18_027748, partial [Sarracenia purpurea var. burkii]
ATKDVIVKLCGHIVMLYHYFITKFKAEASIRNLPPSAIGDPSNMDAMGLLASDKGRPMQA